MLQLIRTWFDICLLRTGPQDLPASGFLLGLSLACYVLVSFLVASPSSGFIVAVQLAALDVGMLIVFVTSLLYLQSKTGRIGQTLSAMAGSGSLMGLFALPLVLLADPGLPADQVSALLAGSWLSLLIWVLKCRSYTRSMVAPLTPVPMGPIAESSGVFVVMISCWREYPGVFTLAML